MRRTAALFAVLLAGAAALTGCAGDGVEPPEVAGAAEIDACYDGDCEVAVEAETTIPLDPAFGLDELVIEGVGPERVFVTHEGGDFNMRVGNSVSPLFEDADLGVSCTLVSLTDGVAVLRLEPVE
ncbi:hypothetical protein [Antribacter gilvus]|uniref:hypothetical protein n=1 Tax=Antribacter gilvus TaxID=2304675 RepID=UPI000F7AE73D|nr:hypothetical protein [Antribacter gilvus]